MGVGSFFHHIGTFFLFCAFILLLIPSISSPVISGISILTVNYGDGDYTFGSWGYCQRQDGALDCTKKMVGYNPALVLRQLDPNIDISSAGENTSKALTRVMVLHPVGCVLAFIGFLLAAIGASTFKSFLASVFSGLAFIVTIVVLATDFTGMSIIHHDANDAKGLSASYGSGIWCVVGAIIALFISTILVFITCCAGRRKGKHTEPTTTEKIGGKRMLGFGRRRAAAV